jgi:hypothetical protein
MLPRIPRGSFLEVDEVAPWSHGLYLKKIHSRSVLFSISAVDEQHTEKKKRRMKLPGYGPKGSEPPALLTFQTHAGLALNGSRGGRSQPGRLLCGGKYLTSVRMRLGRWIDPWLCIRRAKGAGDRRNRRRVAGDRGDWDRVPLHRNRLHRRNGRRRGSGRSQHVAIET